MGNSHSSKSSPGGKPVSSPSVNPPEVQQNPAGPSSNNGAPKGMTRSASGADLQDRLQTQYHPVEKLGKILAKKCEEEHGINGITGDIFAVNNNSFAFGAICCM